MKIVYFVESKFCQRDYDRYGVLTLQENFVDVEVWDFSPYLRASYYEKYTAPNEIHFNKHIIINNKREALLAISHLSKSDVIISLIGFNRKSASIYTYLNSSGASYGHILCSMMPPMQDSILLTITYKVSPSKIFSYLIDKLQSSYIDAYKPQFLMTGGRSYKAHLSYIRNKDIALIKAHSFDYDRVLELNNTVKSDNEYILFLDQDLPNHPDTISNRIVSSSDYYSKLNEFFLYIEKVFRIKVVISKHPRTSCGKNMFNGRQVIADSTASLAKDAKLILAHYSTSISFAIIYNKPIIFIIEDQYHLRAKIAINKIASHFDQTPVDISSNEYDFKKDCMAINYELYQKYMNAYIKEKGTPEKQSWEMFSDYLNAFNKKNCRL